MAFDTYYRRLSCIKPSWSNLSIWQVATSKLVNGWLAREEKKVFQAALRMVVVKDSRWNVGEFFMNYGRIWCENVRLVKKILFDKGVRWHVSCDHREKREEREREKKRERKWRGCPLANLFLCGCCLFGACPVFVWFVVFSWRNANLARGFAGRRGCWPWVFYGWFWFACFYVPTVSVYKCLSDNLCSCKDRALERHRPNAREKKKRK